MFINLQFVASNPSKIDISKLTTHKNLFYSLLKNSHPFKMLLKTVRSICQITKRGKLNTMYVYPMNV